jgi:hypothetical protein
MVSVGRGRSCCNPTAVSHCHQPGVAAVIPPMIVLKHHALHQSPHQQSCLCCCVCKVKEIRTDTCSATSPPLSTACKTTFLHVLDPYTFTGGAVSLSPVARASLGIDPASLKRTELHR